jgi:hypothetical protein
MYNLFIVFNSDVQSNNKAGIPQIGIDKNIKYVDERRLSANKDTVFIPSVKKPVFGDANCLSVGKTGLLIDCY